jgi:uncharacterized protein involved in tellurium resistance
MPYIGKKTAIKLRKSITFKTIKVVLDFLSGEKKAGLATYFFLFV